MNVNVQNLSFGYNKSLTVLQDISLSIDNLEPVAIIGPSGCGKSTFLRLLCGILPNEKTNFLHGQIYIDGNFPTDFVKNNNVGFMFQEPALFPNLTVFQNIVLPLKLKGYKNYKNITSELISKVGLNQFINYYPSELSGGMKTRVSLARTFISQPKLLLLDEPFNSLDIKWKFTLYKELVLLIDLYKPLTFIVTHDINEALLLSNQIYVFGKSGTVLKEVIINKPLPRVNQDDSLKNLQSEYYEIQNLIMNE
jgi:ABC-type nitrate/sulfonate/bicarbonate transport system ATPase subunit